MSGLVQRHELTEAQWRAESIIALNKSISHWEEMITWVKAQEPNDKADRIRMENCIGQHWQGEYCALCLLVDELRDSECDVCPLNKHGYQCGQPNSPWISIDESPTWGEWLVGATRMVEIMKQVLAKVEAT
jgi:hypothetical protein